MSRTIRNRKTAYDNIAVGGASGLERLIAGAAATSEEYGGGTNLAVGTSWHTTDPGENIAVGSATPLNENVDLTSGGTT